MAEVECPGYFAQLQAEEPEWIDGIKVFKNAQKLRNEALDVRVGKAWSLGATGISNRRNISWSCS